MLRKILTILWISSQISCQGQNINFPNPESVDADEARLLYKKNFVQKIEVLRLNDPINSEHGLDVKVIEQRKLDSNGYLIYSNKLGSDGRDITVTQKFDSHGNLLQFKQFVGKRFFHESRYYYNPDNTLFSRVTINFNGKIDSTIQTIKVEFIGKKKITTNEEGAFAAKIIEEYDEKGMVYKSTTLGQNGLPIQIWYYELNDLGQILKKHILKSISVGISKYIYFYDKNNQKIVTKIYDQNDRLIKTISNEYSSIGLLLKETTNDIINNKSNTETFRYHFF